MLSVVDETDDDWQAITALGSWAEFDAFFAEKYIDSECFAAGCTVVVTNADGVVHHRAAGIAWWVGMGSTCFGFHPEARVGVLVYGTHASPLGGAMGGKGRKTTTRLGAFRDTINAAFHLDRQ